jgi:hypothetical protein
VEIFFPLPSLYFSINSFNRRPFSPPTSIQLSNIPSFLSFPRLITPKTQLSIKRSTKSCAPTQSPTQMPTQSPTQAPTVATVFLVVYVDTNTVSRCVWGGNCVDADGSGFNGPVFMTFWGNRLYVGNLGDLNGTFVTTCNWVSSNNTLSGCVNTDVGGSTAGVAAYSLSNGTTYLFVTVDFIGIVRCTIAPGDGTLSGCTDTGVTITPFP